MKIEILEFEQGAQQAEGLCVIIDVFRAFSTACYLVAQGASKIYPVMTVNEAFNLHCKKPQALLLGERGGAKVKGFAYGNSPSLLKDANFNGAEIIMTTTNGTKGLLNAQHAETIITGSFVNAGAIVSFIKQRQPAIVSLVAMGLRGQSAEEDLYLAHYLQARLVGEDYDFEQIKKALKSGSGKRFFDPTVMHSPEQDFAYCLALNKFDFVLSYDPKQKVLLPLN